MKKILLITGIFCIVIISCKKNDNDSSQLPLLPLDVNNTWTYIDSTFDTFILNVRTDTLKLQYGYYTEKKGYKGYSRIPFTDHEPASMINSDNDGNLIQYFISDSLSFKTIMLKKNAKMDETWKFKDVIFTGNGFNDVEIVETEVKCIAIDTIISTPAGNFTCTGYAYSPDKGFGLLNLYYAENVGLILFLYENSDVYRKRILIKYLLN